MLHQIGVGVLGPVFRAYQPDPGRLVAVKQFRLDIPPDSAHRFVAALDRLIAADLTHPGIAAPLAAGLEGFTPYLALDFVAADSFDVVLRDYGPVPVADALRVATQLAAALDYGAVVQVYHGALHPRDVLVSSDDTRVTGLGVAQVLESLRLAPPVRRPYTAPERIAGGTWDRRADVFSLAALIYEMLFGRRIAGLGRDAAEAITAVEGADADALRSVFAQALAEEPAERFETAQLFADALRGALAAAAQPPKTPKIRRKRDTDTTVSRRPVRPTLPLEPELPMLPASDETDLALASSPHEPELRAAAANAGAPAPIPVPDDHVLRPLQDTSVPDLIADVAPMPLRVDDAPRMFTDLELKAAEDERYALVEAGPVAAAEVETEQEFTVEARGLRRDDDDRGEGAADAQTPEVPTRAETSTAHAAATAPPAATLSSVALEQGRSALWPIALALVVGLMVGYAFGYGMGTRERVVNEANLTPAVEPEVRAADSEGAASSVPSSAPVVVVPPAPVGTPATPEPTSRPPVQPAAPRQVQAERTPATPGRIAVRSTPSGARVSVDGRDAGVTPASVRELAVGNHVIRIAHQGYVTAERRVRIRTAQPAQSIEVVLEASRPARQVAAPPAAPERTSGLPADARGAKAGTLMVDSRPAGASVFVDGKMVGTTPLLLDAVTAGEHTVRLELNGFSPWTSGAKVTGGERTRVSGSLEQR